MNDYAKLHKELHDLAASHGIRVDIAPAVRGKDESGWEHKAYSFTVVLTHSTPAQYYTGTYRAGMGIKGRARDFDILASMLLDASTVEYVSTPDEFGQELGYFPLNSGADYRRMMDAYDESHKERAFLMRAFGEHYEKAQELAQQF